ncbi:hypothetical protein V2G26_014105 [Clonostachys chloroleuca]
MSSYTQPQWPTWAYTPEVNDPFSGYPQYNNYSSYLADSMEAYQTHHHHLVHNHQMSRTTESKPRLSKEEVELLEAEFQKNHKPNSTVKKGLAESMRVDNARINNWFQNRRAREKKEKNIREYEARQKLEKDPSQPESGDSAAHRKSDLVASSAPFPNTQTAPSRSHTGTPDGSSSPASLFQAKETPVSDSSVILPSTELSPQLSPELTVKREPGYDDVTVAQYSQIGNSELLADNELSPNALSDSHEQEFMLSAGGSESGYYMSQLNGSAGAPFQASDDFQTAIPQKPSQIIDIAARRNRRPLLCQLTVAQGATQLASSRPELKWVDDSTSVTRSDESPRPLVPCVFRSRSAHLVALSLAGLVTDFSSSDPQSFLESKARTHLQLPIPQLLSRHSLWTLPTQTPTPTQVTGFLSLTWPSMILPCEHRQRLQASWRDISASMPSTICRCHRMVCSRPAWPPTPTTSMLATCRLVSRGISPTLLDAQASQ